MSRSGVILPPEDDPDPTDRLPALGIASGDGLGDPLESTGTWTGGGSLTEAASVEQVRELEDELAGRDAALADLTTRLTQKTFALARVERELAEARAALLPVQAAASSLPGLEERLRDEERARLAAEAERDEQLEAIGRLENQLSEARDNEQRLERKVEDLADQLLETREACSILEDRLAGSEARLAEVEAEAAEAARETMSTVQRREFDQAREQADVLRHTLAEVRQKFAALERERDELQRDLRRREAEAEETAQALRERDLRLERLLEQLRSAEARRRIDSDMRRAEVAPPLPDPRAGILARELEAERSARERLEQAVAMLQAERLRPVPLRRRLLRIDPGHEAAFLLLPPRTTIGRTPDNDLQLSEAYISRAHAVIKLGPESAIIEDAGSRNGVFVNERRVRRERLHDGDLVMLGKAHFRFEVKES